VSVWELILMGYVLVGCLYWLVNLLLAVRVVRRVPQLADTPVERAGPWPRVSQIVPACDEAETIEAAIRARLREGYPDTQLVVVEDRSTDETAVILDRLASDDPRIRVVHVRDLPDAWLGKVHALHQGVQVADGSWFLFSDADVHLAPTALRRAVNHAERHGLDHLAVLPELWPTTFLLDAVLATFVRIFCLITRTWALDGARWRTPLGIGAFNLVRRSAFERTAGFEWLRLEVVDDLGLAQMLHATGAVGGIASGRGLVGLRWYRTLGELARGAEKSALSGAVGFSLGRVLCKSFVLVGLELAPFVGLLPIGPGLPALGLFGVAVALLAQLTLARWARRPLLPAAFVPLAAVLGLVISVRAGWLALRRGGLMWRGKLYPLAQLRGGSRVRPP